MALLAGLLLATGGPGQALAAISPPCVPAPISFGFAPPLDQRLRLDVQSMRPLSDGREQQFSQQYRLIFSAAPRGFRLRATLLHSGSDNPGRIGGTVADILAPLVGKEADYRLSADGRTILLQNGEALWAAVAADLLAAGARSDRAEGQQMGALLGALPLAQREAMLMADIRQLLRFAGRDWSGGYALAPQPDTPDCTIVSLVERGANDAQAAPFVGQRHWRVDARTGLVQHFREARWLRATGEAPLQPAVEASWTLRSE